jgi:hypothetical protein
MRSSEGSHAKPWHTSVCIPSISSISVLSTLSYTHTHTVTHMQAVGWGSCETLARIFWSSSLYSCIHSESLDSLSSQSSLSLSVLSALSQELSNSCVWGSYKTPEPFQVHIPSMFSMFSNSLYSADLLVLHPMIDVPKIMMA